MDARELVKRYCSAYFVGWINNNYFASFDSSESVVVSNVTPHGIFMVTNFGFICYAKFDYLNNSLTTVQSGLKVSPWVARQCEFLFEYDNPINKDFNPYVPSFLVKIIKYEDKMLSVANSTALNNN